MLQKVDMPSFVPDNVSHGDLPKSLSGSNHQYHYAHAQQHHHHQQSSQQQYYSNLVDSPTPATDDLPGGWPKQITPSPNAHPTGPDGSAQWLPNGRHFDDTRSTTSGRSGRDTTPTGRESTLSLRSKRSMGLEGEKRSLDVPVVTKTPSTDEEGYFTGIPNFSKPNGIARSPTSKQNLPALPPSNDLPPASNPMQRSTSLALPASAPAPSPLPSVSENNDVQMLRVPHSAHRASSPPAFSQTPSSLAALASQTAPNKLVQRHTLEVPKTSRTSRDGQPSTTTDDAIVSATGRFSPNAPSKRRGSSQLVRRATRSINSDMHLDELAQDDDAARWTEHIKQKRASKRKRDEDEERVVVGTKVDQNHVNWVTAYNMLTGIRFTVSRTNAKIDRELNDADFNAKHKFSFDM